MASKKLNSALQIDNSSIGKYKMQELRVIVEEDPSSLY